MLRILLLAAIFSSQVLGQQASSSESLYTIQTSPPEPPSSSISSASSTSSGSQASSASSALSPASTTGPGSFPMVCSSQCSNVSNALSTCGAGGDLLLNTTCLCTPEVEQSYLACVQCAISLDPSRSSLSSYQALINAYIAQCANDPVNPITLSNVTVTLPSTISSSSPSASSSSVSASTTSSSRSSAVLPSSMVSHPPLSSSAATSSSAPSAAMSSGAAIPVLGPLPGRWSWSAFTGLAAMGLGAWIVV